MTPERSRHLARLFNRTFLARLPLIERFRMRDIAEQFESLKDGDIPQPMREMFARAEQELADTNRGRAK